MRGIIVRLSEEESELLEDVLSSACVSDFTNDELSKLSAYVSNQITEQENKMGESMKMNFCDAFDQAKDDDFLFSPAAGDMPDLKFKKQQVLAGLPVHALRVLRTDWKIIRAEPKVLSAEALARECFNHWWNMPLSKDDMVHMTEKDLKEFADKCRDNYRLERDLELRPLVEKAREIVTEYEDGQGGTLFKELREELYQNFKPLNEND